MQSETDEFIQEYADSRGIALRVEAGVLGGVKLIGLTSRNGRRYREDALAKAAMLYEDAKVNVNHPKDGPLAPRDYQDRIGVIRNVEFRAGDGLFGDLHYNPKHALSEQLAWDAQHNPRNVGFSHNVQARLSRDEAGTVVEEIVRVQSVDLVADPATTEGLFEQTENSPRWDALTLETLRMHRPDLLAEIEAINSAQLKTLREETEARIAILERGQRISELLCKHGLPVPARLGVSNTRGQGIVNAAFIETLLAIDDDAEIERRVVERAELVRNASNWHGQFQRGPRSRDQFALEGQTLGDQSPRDFARAIKVR